MNLLHFLTPTNLAVEKARFFASTTYHPTFTYDWNNQEMKEWSQQHPRYSRLVNALRKQDYKNIVREVEKNHHEPPPEF